MLPRLRESASSGNKSPLKLVKAATWNGRSSEIIELFDIQKKASELHPSFGPADGNPNDNDKARSRG